MTKDDRNGLRDLTNKWLADGGVDVVIPISEIVDLLDTCDEFVRDAAQQSETIERHMEAWHSNQREIELLRAAVKTIYDSFGLDDPERSARGVFAGIDKELGRPLSAVAAWDAHLDSCDDCNYGGECTACVADGEHPPEHHACNCSVNGTGQKLRAAADAEAKAAL